MDILKEVAFCVSLLFASKTSSDEWIINECSIQIIREYISPHNGHRIATSKDFIETESKETSIFEDE